MNVLVWSSWVAQPVGGAERVALELALQLHARGHRVVLSGAYDNAPELRCKIPPEMPYYPFDIHRRRVKPHWKAARLFARIMGEQNIQVASAHGSVFALHEVCRRRHVPMVWTIHGAAERSTGIIGRLKTAAVRRVLTSDNTHIVGVSRATIEIIRRQFPRLDARRWHVIHNGIIGAEALMAVPLPRPGPPWNLGFVGRVAERKRPLDLVEVARQLRSAMDFTLHVFGDGPLLDQLREAIHKADLERNFILHGYWDKGSAGMVERFQILVHPDSVEPFGGAVLEAQLGGRPVVAYNVGGNPEIVENGVTGWLAPLGDINGLAEGIRQTTGALFLEFAAAARRRAAENFLLPRMIDSYETLFEGLCASPSGAAPQV